MKPLLRLSGITKSFGTVRALNGVSFELYPGEVHALLGENGAGKSTLIKVITGAHAPDAGTITLAEKTIQHLTPVSAHALGIACIYQQPALFPDLTVAENLALRMEPAVAFHRVRWDRRRARAAELLAHVGAEIDPESEIRALSMPEQQLVEIAAAIGTGARIVIMDEPTASLTQREQARLFEVVRELRHRGVGVIYISHRLEEIFALADRVTVLRDGESVGTRNIPRALTRTADAPTESEPGPLTETELIQLMVGRAVNQSRPPRAGSVGAPVISLRDVVCRTSGIQGVSLDVSAGEIVGLAGLVGAGRTELARVLFGLTPADSGHLNFQGQPFKPTSPAEAIARGVAYVPEDRRRHGVILDLPVSANISLASHRRLFPGAWLRLGAEQQLAREQIQALGIRTNGPNATGNSLSGGNQQKVALARWLATHPKLLILDEPTQGVDIGAKSEIHRLIRAQADAGLAVLLISSDLPEVLALSDRIAVMRRGRIVATFDCPVEGHTVMAAALGQKQANSDTERVC